MLWAIVKFNFEGVHSYPDAPEEVAFLRNKHRHMFYVEVYLEQFHNDRDIEFILFKRELVDLFGERKDCNDKSCETIATEILAYLNINYKTRNAKVYVFEDNENGCLLEK